MGNAAHSGRYGMAAFNDATAFSGANAFSGAACPPWLHANASQRQLPLPAPHPRPLSPRRGEGSLWYKACLALLITLCLTTSTRATAPNTLTPDEQQSGWILLFDGETLFGWRPNSKANWTVADGIISASEGDPGLLVTTSDFADYELRLDFRAPADTNSGVFLRTAIKPTHPAKDCYELNIATEAVSPFPTGSFVERKKGKVPAWSDGWHTYEVTAQGGRLVVKLDGEPLIDYADAQPLLGGRIGLQYKSGPVEFRNVKLRPLGLKSLFNGKDLTGWKIFPDRQSEFTVVDGEIDVKNGPGVLESDARFADFVLQFQAKTNGDGLNSGVFFRSIPGEYTNGYESQIHNLVKDGDRTQPVDCGTGGIYRRINARRVVANDRQWFTKTLVASGPHIAVWVNGYQVTDWTDERKPDANPRRGLRLEAGTLQLQGHDPTTDLRFRDLRAVELPK